jgi:hypothetical protein
VSHRTVVGLALALPLLLACAMAAAPVKTKDKDKVKLGVCASLGGKRVLPPDNPWNWDISAAPLDPNSDNLVASIGADAPLHPDFGRNDGIPYVVVPGNQPRVPTAYAYAGESDPGPYPVPPDAPIEGGPQAKGDRHILVLDRDNWILYELYKAYPQDGRKSWKAGSGAVFDLNSNRLRHAGWTSADAAGLPILPGLVRGDEVFEQRAITHAVRFTCKKTRKAYVPPATHYASSSKDPNLPPMGMRARLKASFDIRPFPPTAQIILLGLKKYGIILADNGGDWYITGAPDPRWNNEELNALKRVKGRDFEVIRMDGLAAK